MPATTAGTRHRALTATTKTTTPSSLSQSSTTQSSPSPHQQQCSLIVASDALSTCPRPAAGWGMTCTQMRSQQCPTADVSKQHHMCCTRPDEELWWHSSLCRNAAAAAAAQQRNAHGAVGPCIACETSFWESHGMRPHAELCLHSAC